MSKEAKALSNAKILEQAARLFRENGVASTGVAEVMEAAGLTHGGFYRHFKSKEELAIAAIGQAMDKIIERFRVSVGEKGARLALLGFIERYLSMEHVLHPGIGCPIAALGTEAGRGRQSYQKPLSIGYEALVGIIALGIEGKPEKAQSVAADILTILVGTIVIARTLEEKAEIEEVLTAGLNMAMEKLGVKADE